MVDDDARICDSAIVGDLPDFVVGEGKNSVSAFSYPQLFLGESMEFLAHRWYPEVFQVRIMLEFFVLCNGFFCHRMDNTKTMLFNVDDGFRPLCVGGNLECLEAHDVVNGLDCYVAGQSCGDDSC